MDTYKMNLTLHARRLTSALLAGLLVGLGSAQAQSQLTLPRLMSAVPDHANRSQPNTRSIAPNTPDAPEYVTRTGAVMLDVTQLMQRPTPTARQERAPDSKSVSKFPTAQGETFILEMFEQHAYTVHVTSESRPEPDILNLSGKIDSEDIATLSMTVTADSYLITLQDLNTSKVYRIVGNSETGLGTVTEVDVRKMPPILYSPPVMAP